MKTNDNKLSNSLEIHQCCTCTECGAEIAFKDKKSYPAFCTKCKPIKNIKENWKPLGAGSVSKIFIIP